MSPARSLGFAEETRPGGMTRSSRRSRSSLGFIGTFLFALVLCCYAGATTASADTIDLAAYRARLADARALVASARAAPESARADLLARARDLLRRTDAVRLSSGPPLAIDDAALADRLAPATESLDRALADLDARVGWTDRGLRPGALDAANVDARLAALLRERDAARRELTPLELIAAWVADRIEALFARLASAGVDFGFVPFAVAGLGVALALVLVAILGRGVRERIRREVLLAGTVPERAIDPSVHARAADEALAAGRLREALHELYLYALSALAAREALRYDPSLTDRELLARAVGLAEIGSLEQLVALHERVWFGLKPAVAGDAARARELARRLAA